MNSKIYFKDKETYCAKTSQKKINVLVSVPDNTDFVGKTIYGCG